MYYNQYEISKQLQQVSYIQLKYTVSQKTHQL